VHAVGQGLGMMTPGDGGMTIGGAAAVPLVPPPGAVSASLSQASCCSFARSLS
jgi:hypothetical protein